MRFSPSFLDEIRARVPVSEVVRKTREAREAGQGVARALALQRREDALLLRQRPEGLLPRLLLRQAWRRLRLSDGDGGTFLPRGGRAARRARRACRCRSRQKSSASRTSAARRSARFWKGGRTFSRSSLPARPDARRAPISTGARSLADAREKFRLGFAPARAPCAARPSRRQGRQRRDDDRGGAAHPRRGHRRPL